MMVSRIKALMYNQFFYCPAMEDIGLTGGVARLDRIQIILPTDRAVYDPLPIALSEDALAVLVFHVEILVRLSRRRSECIQGAFKGDYYHPTQRPKPQVRKNNDARVSRRPFESLYNRSLQSLVGDFLESVTGFGN